MSRWADQFHNHAIRETLRQTREWVGAEFEGIDSVHEAEKRRLSKVLDSFSDVLDGMDPEFFPDAQVTALNNHLRHQNFWNQLSTYSTNGKVLHLKTANDHVNSQIANVYQIAGMGRQPESREAIANVEAAYDTFCKEIEKKKLEFEKIAGEQAAELAKLRAKSDELDNSLIVLKEKADSQFAGWQKEFTTGETARIEEFSKAELARKQDYATERDQFRNVFTEDRVELTTKHDEALQKAFDDYLSDVKAKSDEMKVKHDEILELHGLVTTDGVAGGYKKGADDEKLAAFGWSVVSMICYGLILLWVVFKGKLGFGIADMSGVDWPIVVTTVSVTAVTFVAAQYAGKQSRIHRMNEQRMR